MKSYKIALIPGDGIGPEQAEATLKVLETVKTNFGLDLEMKQVEAGDGCLKRRGTALPEDTLNTIRKSNAVLKGPVGETAADVIVKLRLMFDTYANLRPAKVYPNVPCLRPDIDFLIVRENTEDVYKGIEFTVEGGAVALRIITQHGSERIAKYAFEMARRRNKKLKVTAVHKANIMRVTDGLFARVCREVAKKNPDIKFNEMYVDAAAMNLIRAPQDFDIILTTNVFGDILSDEAAQLVGGLGLAPSANVGEKFAIFEPVHGSAPDIAGKQIANPVSMILTAKMMLDWLGQKHNDSTYTSAAEAVEKAVIKTLRDGITTPDLGGKAKTSEVGEAVGKRISKK